jgi:hypothetical protein
MFGRKKKKENQIDAAIETAVGLLQLQMSLANGQGADEFSRGYIFGLCDAIFQAAGVRDQAEMAALITIVHAELFGQEKCGDIVGQSMRDQRNSTFADGRMSGGQELIAFLADQTPPMGLAQHLMNS